MMVKNSFLDIVVISTLSLMRRPSSLPLVISQLSDGGCIGLDLSGCAALILVPTRELALQTSQVCKELGKHMNIEVMVSTGGTSLKEDIMRLYSKVHILVATPGRVLDLANKRVADLSNCTTIVMDEVCAPPLPPFLPPFPSPVNTLHSRHIVGMLSAVGTTSFTSSPVRLAVG